MEDRGVGRGKDVMGLRLSEMLEIDSSYTCWLARIAENGKGGKYSVLLLIRNGMRQIIRALSSFTMAQVGPKQCQLTDVGGVRLTCDLAIQNSPFQCKRIL